jgi:ribonuclease VapC
MVVDTSAVMAILQLEAEAQEFAALIDSASVRLISSVSPGAGILAESRKGSAGAAALDAFLQQASLLTVAFDLAQSAAARDAFRRFGKGRHPAELNLGDCAAYALSRISAEPLLFKGTDFAKTDVAIVPMPIRN